MLAATTIAATALTMGGAPLVAPRVRPVAMNADIAALEKQMEMLQIQKQIADLQKLTAAPAPVPAPVPVAIPAPVIEAPIAAMPVPAPVLEAPSNIAALEKQMEMLELQKKIADLQKLTAAPAPVPAPVPVAIPAPVIEAPVAAMSMPVEAPMSAAIQALPDTVAPAAASGMPFGLDIPHVPFLEGLPFNMGVIIPLALVPAGYFGATAFAGFVNSKYDEIQGREPADSPSFAPRARGNQMANKMQKQLAAREAEMEVERAMSWDTVGGVRGDGTRNAQDIFFGGLESLSDSPTGWLFGAPSALYSNQQEAARSEPPTMPMPDEVMMPPVPVPATPVASAAPLTPATPMPSVSFVGDGAMETGRVVPTGSKAKDRKEKRAAGRVQRVPPSSPEEVEAARRGEYDYTGGQQ